MLSVDELLPVVRLHLVLELLSFIHATTTLWAALSRRRNLHSPLKISLRPSNNSRQRYLSNRVVSRPCIQPSSAKHTRASCHSYGYSEDHDGSDDVVLLRLLVLCQEDGLSWVDSWSQSLGSPICKNILLWRRELWGLCCIKGVLEACRKPWNVESRLENILLCLWWNEVSITIEWCGFWWWECRSGGSFVLKRSAMSVVSAYEKNPNPESSRTSPRDLPNISLT